LKDIFPPEWPFINTSPPTEKSESEHEDGRQPSQGLSLLGVLREMYDSPVLVPVLPYVPDLFLGKRLAPTMTDGRPEELTRIADLWPIPIDGSDEEWESRAEELVWFATLLTAGTSKPGHLPRVDFFMMHAMTTAIFIPSILHILTNQSKRLLLTSYLRVVLLFVLLVGRPRINPELLMSYTEFPQPPAVEVPITKEEKSDALGSLANPWPAIINSAVFHPNAHTPKTIRALAYAAQKYGTTPAGGAIGAYHRGEDRRETHIGAGKMDGTIFVRAAGVVMNAVGWVDHGEKVTRWDRSCLGYDDAWKQ
jgi:hypothetical protein